MLKNPVFLHVQFWFCSADSRKNILQKRPVSFWICRIVHSTKVILQIRFRRGNCRMPGLGVGKEELETAAGDVWLNRRFGGIRTACPSPVNERSASFRRGFRFVRVVRAVRVDEAKLRGRMTIVVLIAGPPGWEYPGVCAPLFGSFWLLFRMVLIVSWCFVCLELVCSLFT